MPTFREVRVWPLAERAATPLIHLIQDDEAVVGSTLCGQSARNPMQDTPPLELLNLEPCAVCQAAADERRKVITTAAEALAVVREFLDSNNVEGVRSARAALALIEQRLEAASDFAQLEAVEIDSDEAGFVLTVASDSGQRLHFRLPDPELLYDTVRREIGPWLRERDLARATQPTNEEDAYDVSDPKHPRHHDVFAALSDTKEDA